MGGSEGHASDLDRLPTHGLGREPSLGWKLGLGVLSSVFGRVSNTYSL